MSGNKSMKANHQSGGLQALAMKVAKQGRNGDSVLVHMQPREVAALAKLGEQQGEPLSLNPTTGMPEMFSLWKTLLGIGALAAAPFTGGISAALGLGSLSAGTAAAIGTGLATIGGSTLASGLAPDQGSGNPETDYRKKLQEDAQNFVKVPVVKNIQSPAPSPKTGAPGVVPEPIQTHQNVSGYITPAPGFYAEGGKIDQQPHEGQVVVEAMHAFHGRHPRPSQALEMFRQTFGDEELQHFLSEMQGGEQSEQGQDVGFLRGPGAGMDDKIPAHVEQRPIALSDGEYVVPADVVAHLGDGSSEAGAEVLDAMRDRVRQVKTGKTEQPGKIDPRKVLPR